MIIIICYICIPSNLSIISNRNTINALNGYIMSNSHIFSYGYLTFILRN